MLFPGPSQNVQGPRLNDRQVMPAADGSPIAQGYGACRVGAQLIWGKRGPDGNIIVEHSKTTSQSAKGGPSKRKQRIVMTVPLHSDLLKGQRIYSEFGRIVKLFTTVRIPAHMRSIS